MATAIAGSLAGYITLFLVLVLFTYVRSWQRLRHIPGPPSWGWSVLPLFRLHLQGAIYDKFGELNRHYGPLVRIAPNTLLVADPDVLRRMSAVRSPYTRADWYIAMRLNPGQDNVLAQRDEGKHDDLRRRMMAGYSGKENLALERDIDDCVLDLVRLIERKYLPSPGRDHQPVPMDLARKIQFFTSDVMSKLSFDAKFHDLRDDNDNLGYIHEVETMFPNIFCTCTIPKVIDFLTNIGFLGLFAPSANSKLGLGKVLAITREQTAKRFDSQGKPKGDYNDMLGSFIRHGLTKEEAESESVMQLAAGSDTSATGMRATLRCIISSPMAYVKLMAEIDEAIASGKIPSDENQVVSNSNAKELPYLQACIKEGLRWYPPIAGMLAKKVPRAGDRVCGYFVPGGTSMAYSAKAVHHSAALFGPDEYAFRPERWILTKDGGDEPSVEKLKAMEQNNELIFGYGKYQCLGKSVALIELNKIYVELLRRFQFSLMDPLDVWKTKCFGIHLQKDMWVTVKRRPKV
ncbi:uncharacterized protein Z519_03040 [Cladophialophora bantiana CBS 173.52]|uniref:Cytochrome P450 oxidoreductase n=1 Tax=Cladophialophora bantiana (strain ATCC 10958 / CBS 173.52 / CDC B-1940 / NIH 8579) TaxID=1442370 RepID=A0A0D2IGV6_CLAB1|nr:uncharacterized protein Z519_03040 [Cladophialophora bantiana CBS 173.52]KIW95974.1 hypothetical protein Z519_03040 [Cladophialophora bantiana CBS 173.52]